MRSGQPRTPHVTHQKVVACATLLVLAQGATLLANQVSGTFERQ